MTAFCCLCGNTNPRDLGQVIGICLDADACHERQAERLRRNAECERYAYGNPGIRL